VRGDPEVARHLAGRRTVRHLLQDLALPLRKRRRLGLVARRLRLLDEGLRELGVDHRVAFDRVLGGIDEGVGGRVLQEVPGDPGLDRLRDGTPGLVDRDEDDLRLRGGLPDPSGGLDPVHAGHPDVHEHDVGRELASLFHGLLAAAGLPDHDDGVVGQLQRRAETLSGHGVVIDDERSDRHRSP
jgi:hypothetical protein